MKQIASTYTYNKATGAIVMTGVNIDRDQLLLIVNTTQNVTYYNFADSATKLQAFTQGTNTSITLNSAVVTAAATHANSDTLIIYYDDQTSSSTITANAGTGTFNISDKGSTGESTVTSFTSTSSAVLKASNSNRKLLTIFNEGNGTLFILLGSGTASTSNYSLRLLGGDYYELEKYTGELNAIFASSGTAKVTEIT